MLNSALLNGAADLIAEFGGDALDIARRSKIPPAALFRGDIPVLGYSMTDFFELAAAECNYRYIGIELAEREKEDPLGVLGALIDSARTVGEMLIDLATHFDVFSEAAVVSLERTDGGMITTFEGRAGHCESEVQMVEFALARTVLSIRRQSRPDWSPTAVVLRHAAPRELTRHREIFGTGLMFEQDRNGIFYDQSVLDSPWRARTARNRADAIYALRAADAGRKPLMAAKVEVAMRSRMNLSEATIEFVTAQLGVPSRTLQRKLEAEDTSFRMIRNTVRADLALKYVRQSRLSLTQIAEILGYSELSAFDRAFRHWHGRSPTALRRETTIEAIAT